MVTGILMSVFFLGGLEMIHQYKLNGFNIVLDTYSGGVHCVDDLSYDIIELYNDKKSKDEITMRMLDKYKNLGITKRDIEDTFLVVSFFVCGELFTVVVFIDAYLVL